MHIEYSGDARISPVREQIKVSEASTEMMVKVKSYASNFFSKSQTKIK